MKEKLSTLLFFVAFLFFLLPPLEAKSKEAYKKAIKKLRQGKTVAEQIKGARELASKKIPASQAIPPLIRALDRGNIRLLDAVHRALLKRGKEALPYLIRGLKSRKMIRRLEVSKILVKMGPQAVPSLLQALRDKKMGRARADCAVILFKIGQKRWREMVRDLSFDGRVYRDFSRPIRVKKGEKFTLSLTANRSTGYRWKLTISPKGGGIKFLKKKYKRKFTLFSQDGGGGRSLWTFRAQKKGKWTIKAEYGSPDGKTVVQTKKIALIVQ